MPRARARGRSYAHRCSQLRRPCRAGGWALGIAGWAAVPAYRFRFTSAFSDVVRSGAPGDLSQPCRAPLRRPPAAADGESGSAAKAGFRGTRKALPSLPDVTWTSTKHPSQLRRMQQPAPPCPCRWDGTCRPFPLHRRNTSPSLEDTRGSSTLRRPASRKGLG